MDVLNSILIKNVTIVSSAKLKTQDILIIDGLITKINSAISTDKIIEINAEGLLAMPGLFDMHVHLRDPDFTKSEDIYSGSCAALRGGFARVACMANTNPVNDNPQVTSYIIKKAQQIGMVRVYPVSSITKNLLGRELVDFEKMKEAGAIAFSDDGFSISDDGILQDAMERIKVLGSVMISHCENKKISKNGVIRESKIAYKLSLPIYPKEAEISFVDRDIKLAKKTGCPIHITHVSTKESVELIRDAKKSGIKITADVTPHHLFLNYDDMKRDDANFKMNPPLCGKEDNEALINGLIDGTIDAVASDHAPHTKKEKEKGFLNSPFGVIGLETTLSLVYELVHNKKISIQKLVKILNINPSSILKIKDNEIAEGKIADLILFDPNYKGQFTLDSFLSKSSNSPFIGRNFRGKVKLVVADGTIHYENEAKL